MAARKPDAVRDAIAIVYGDQATTPDTLLDQTRPIHPTDALEDRVRREYLDRQAQRDRYPSQEFVATLNTGRDIDAERWRERQAADAMLHEQTEVLAAALERTGVPTRGASDVTAIGLITGAQESLNNYRSICFFPLVAQRDRRPMLNELRYFRSTYRNHGKYMRVATVTNGTPVPLGSGAPAAGEDPQSAMYFELRRRLQDLARRVSRFADWARAAYGIDIVFRNIEFTIKRRDQDEFLSVHPHSHMLYTPRKKLSDARWQQFLEGAHKHFGYHWKDCGVLEKPIEAIKYAFKPCELQRLDDGAVRWLYEQTFRIKMAQPMGAFQQWRRDELLVREWYDDQAHRWIGRETACKKPGPRWRKHRKVVTMEYARGPELGVCSIRKRIGKPRDPHKIVREDQAAPENVLMGITMPQRRFSPYAEPCVLVMNYTPQPATQWGQDTLNTIETERQKVLPVWHMNGAPDPRVALALGRGQLAAREGEAGKVRAFNVHTRSSTADRRTCAKGGQGPPASIDATAAQTWRQLGVDFSTGEVIEPMTPAAVA